LVAHHQIYRRVVLDRKAVPLYAYCDVHDHIAESYVVNFQVVITQRLDDQVLDITQSDIWQIPIHFVILANNGIHGCIYEASQEITEVNLASIKMNR